MMTFSPRLTAATAPQVDVWQEERLREARSVLADISHHPSNPALLACRVIAAHSVDRSEIADAGKTAALLRSNGEVRP